VASGGNLHVICADDSFPNRNTVYKWMRKYKEFSDNYARAREGRADWRSDRMETICEDLKTGVIDHQTARILIDNDKWQAGKENPKRYGDKQQHTGADGESAVKLDTKLEIVFVDVENKD